MFSQSHRLTKTKDIERVFKQGRAYYHELLGIKALKNGLDKSRFTVIISLKVSKKAIQRNLLKRQIRSILKTEAFKLQPGFDVAVVCLPTSAGQDFTAINQAVITCLTKLALYQ